MNPVERFWRAIDARDWTRAAEELHPDAVVEWPHTGERFQNRDAFIAVNRAYPGDWRVHVKRIVSEGRHIASEVVVTGGETTYYVASFFTLREGRIARVTEYWVDGTAQPPEWRVAMTTPEPGD